MTTTKKFDLPSERKILYVSSSGRDLHGFPEEVIRVVATALEVARLGGKHPSAKPWHGEGIGVFEIVVNEPDAYRAVYTIRYREAVYLLHAFQKKSTKGVKTAARDVNTVRSRLKVAAQDYEERYGKDKTKRARK